MIKLKCSLVVINGVTANAEDAVRFTDGTNGITASARFVI
jgi:hypothetical protein